MNFCRNLEPDYRTQKSKTTNKLGAWRGKTSAAQSLPRDRQKMSRSARKDKIKWIDDIANHAQQVANSGNMKKTYRLARKFTNKGFSSERPIRSAEGKLCISEPQQTDRWTEYFKDLLNKPTQDMSRSPPTPRVNRGFKQGPPSVEELKTAIKQLKSGKSPGSDNMHPEMFKIKTSRSAEILAPIIREAWEKEEIPDKWKEDLIIKLPKKDDLSVCTNWRGIILLNTINKIMASIIHKRVTKVPEPTLRKEQAGFKSGRSCIDQINTLRIIVEQSVEWQSPLYLLFIDFRQAFDSLDRDVMWKILASYGMPTKYLNIIKATYADARCMVVHRGKIDQSFTVHSGVKQGCILSPLLFILILDWVMRKANTNARGIRWTLTRYLEELDFADDICLLAHKRSDMEAKLR